MAARRWRRVGALTALWLNLAAAGWAGDWQQITAPPQLSFPRDHGAHPELRSEWWYATGLVDDGEGRRHGFQLTFFRQGMDPRPPAAGASALRARQILAAHLAVVDLQDGVFRHAERLRRADGGLAGMSTTDLELWLDDWRITRRDDGAVILDARDGVQGIGVSLALRPSRALVAHGDRGYSAKGGEAGNASAYLSWTRMAVTGSLEVAGRRRPVSGAAWFDHEWGSSQLGAGVVGWDWFALRLADGSDLMLYQLRKSDGAPSPFSGGTLVTPAGSSVHLGADDFAIEVLDHWTSPTSDATYPSRWQLELPLHDMELELTPMFPAAEVDGSLSTGVIYWEGPVAVTGSAAGEGYVELTGYATDLEGRF